MRIALPPVMTRASATGRLMRRNGLHRSLPALAAVGVMALVAAWIFGHAEPHALEGDAEMLLHPLLVDALRQARAGEVPVWTAGRWGGSPLLADAVAGALYPPYYVAYASTPPPHTRGLDVSVVLHAGLLAAGFVWSFRRFGFPGIAGVASAALLVMNPSFVVVSRNWHQYWAALAYWPWLFGACAALAARPTVPMGVLGAVALAGPVYAGYPEFALYAGIVGLAWVVLGSGRAWRRGLAVASCVGGGAVALAMPQIVSGLGMAFGSIRFGPGAAERAEQVNRFFALTPAMWQTVLLPTPQMFVLKIAPSVAVLALVGALDRRPVARWLLVATCVAAILATGANPVYDMLHRLPPFNFFVAPLKLFYLVDFLALVLAGFGLARLPALGVVSQRIVVGLLASVLLVSVPTGAAAILLLAVASALAPRRTLVAIAVVLALGGGGAFLHASRALELPPNFLPRAPLMGLLRRPPPVEPPSGARVLALSQDRALRQVGLNFGSLWNVEAWNGMGDLVQWRQHAIMENAVPGAGPRLARLVGADPVVVEGGTDLERELVEAGFEVRTRDHGLAWLSPPAPPAPVLLARRAKDVSADEAVAHGRRGRGLDGGRVLIETTSLDAGRRGDPSGQVELVHREPGAVRARVSVARPTWLVIREPYYAKWRATVDGRSVPVYPAAGFLLGVLVEAGTHDVQVTYRESGLVVAFVVALGVALLLPRLLRRAIAVGVG